MPYKNKIKKSIRLYHDTYEMVEAYRKLTNEDFTNGLESLLIKGLENHHSLQNISKKIKIELDSIKRFQKELDNKIIKILISQTKLLGEIKALTKVHIIKSGVATQEEVNNYSKQGIKKSLEELREERS